MPVAVHACTRRSSTHPRNQDRAVVGREVLDSVIEVEPTRLDAPTVIAVLDGLGGHAAGDAASELAARLLAGAAVPDDEDAVTALLLDADEAVHAAARAEPAKQGMGTTAAVLALHSDAEALVANVGDSPVFQLRDGRLEHLTVADRLGGGILQCLGGHTGSAVHPHVRRVPLVPGDRLLLASDGLTDVVTEEAIAAMLRGDPEYAATRLLSTVEASGTPDDVTIVIVEVLDGRS